MTASSDKDSRRVQPMFVQFLLRVMKLSSLSVVVSIDGRDFLRLFSYLLLCLFDWCFCYRWCSVLVLLVLSWMVVGTTTLGMMTVFLFLATIVRTQVDLKIDSRS